MAMTNIPKTTLHRCLHKLARYGFVRLVQVGGVGVLPEEVTVMEVASVAKESLGMRSMCLYVETHDVRTFAMLDSRKQ
jgi:DNA-binding IclR family transcriptional regulator